MAQNQKTSLTWRKMGTFKKRALRASKKHNGLFQYNMENQ